MPLVNSDSAFILIDDFNNTKEKKVIFKGVGRYDIPTQDLVNKLNPYLMEQIGKSREINEVLTLESGIIFPLHNEYNTSMGVIYIESKNFKEGKALIEIYARQAASSINNAFLHSLINMKKEELDKTYKELKKRYLDTIEALRLTVDAKDFYTRGHSDRVAYYAMKLGRAFNLSEDEIELLRLAGIFHDIGKIGTADDILFKTDKLEYDEYEEIKKHPLKGAYILSAISMFQDVVPLVKYHHERVDGKGYPEGLKGEEIPFLARILSVADAFDAMTSDRKYRSKLEVEEAIEQFKVNAGTQFDAEVVNMLIKILEDFETIKKDLAETFQYSL